MTMRPELPELTPRIAQLPVFRGYPVPWFVAWLGDDDDSETSPGHGTPDFRVLRSGAVARAHNLGLCFICGQRLGIHKTFVLGPMCAINRTAPEPPAHSECAEWAAKACPFLSRPRAHRREAGLPNADEPAGIMLRRNPGVTLLWTTRRYRIKAQDPVTGGILFDVGDPETVEFLCEGRTATRAEVDASIASGLPALRELAEAEGVIAMRALDQMLVRAERVLPAP